MTPFPILPSAHDSCDAATLLPIPYTVKIVFYPNYLKKLVAAAQVRSYADAPRPAGELAPEYQMRLRGKLHPFEYRFNPRRPQRPDLMLADAYDEVAQRYSQTRLHQARLFCSAAAVRYAKAKNMDEVSRVMQHVYGVSEDYGWVEYRILGLLPYYVQQLCLHAYRDRRWFLSQLSRLYGYGNQQQ